MHATQASLQGLLLAQALELTEPVTAPDLPPPPAPTCVPALQLTYGHGLLTQLGGLARLMEGELDAVALFLMLFHVVSAVTARPSQDE